MACGRCAANIDYCVKPWFQGEDEHASACYPPSKFKKFLAISRDGEPSVWGLREDEDIGDTPLPHFLVTEDYCEAKAFADVLAVGSL